MREHDAVAVGVDAGDLSTPPVAIRNNEPASSPWRTNMSPGWKVWVAKRGHQLVALRRFDGGQNTRVSNQVGDHALMAKAAELARDGRVALRERFELSALGDQDLRGFDRDDRRCARRLADERHLAEEGTRPEHCQERAAGGVFAHDVEDAARQQERLATLFSLFHHERARAELANLERA